ncbi:MAG: hypothetical protein ACHQ52_10785 [Candidatus Eisenbacteria bacterium]
MAVHRDLPALLRESLPQYVQGAEILSSTQVSTGGVLGYPAVTLLLAVVYSIGSYLEGTSVPIERKQVTISGFAQHVYALNSKYFNLGYQKKLLDAIYQRCRSPLVHNAAIAPAVVLVPDIHPSRIVFLEDANEYLQVSVGGLLRACEAAVPRFLKDSDELVRQSRVASNLAAKDPSMRNASPKRVR